MFDFSYSFNANQSLALLSSFSAYWQRLQPVSPYALPIKLALFIQIVFNLIAITFAWTSIAHLRKVRCIHINHRVLFGFLFAQNYISYIATVLINADLLMSDYVRIASPLHLDVAVLCKMFSWFYLSVHCISSCIERCFSEIFIKDYESKSRLWICISLGVGATAATLYLITATTLELLPRDIVINLFLFVVPLFVMLIIFFLYYYMKFAVNNRIMCSYNAAENYLHVRYQVNENYNLVLKGIPIMMANAVLLIAYGIFLHLLFGNQQPTPLEVLLFTWADTVLQIVHRIMHCFFMYFLGGCSAEFKKYIEKMFRARARRRQISTTYSNNKNRVATTDESAKHTSNLYFQHLSTQWE